MGTTRALLLLLVASCATTAWSTSDVLCQTYVVQSGDSIWSIAQKFGLQQDELTAAIQQCAGNAGALQVGQKVCLANYVPACDYVIESGSVADCKAYQIQTGDTLVSIASIFGIYVQDLTTLNSDLAGSVLRPGTFVRLPPWKATCPDPDADAPSCRVYAVQSGDFAFGIASIFRVTLQALLDANPGLEQGTVLQAGQRIRIPPFTSECGNGVLATPPTTGVFSCRAYRVKQGDSLASIALKFETTTASLVQTNPELADPSLLTPGYIVKIAPYPGECLNGILIDPSGTAAATPSGPITAYSPSPATSSPSPSPSPVASSPSPSPSPAAASPSPSPSPAAAAPSTGIKATLTLTAISSTDFTATKATQLAAIIANLIGVPSSWISVTAAASSRRRLQATNTTVVTVTIPSQQPASAASKLQSAAASGSLAVLLSQLGLNMASNSLSVTTYGIAAASPSPSPTVTSPSPAPSTSSPSPSTTSSSSSGDGSSNIGAIVGGVVGGVVGVCLIAAAAWYIVRRRRAAAASAGSVGGHAGGVTASVTAGGGMTIKTRTTHLAEDQAYSSSPRNTVTPRTRVGNMA